MRLKPKQGLNFLAVLYDCVQNEIEVLGVKFFLVLFFIFNNFLLHS